MTRKDVALILALSGVLSMGAGILAYAIAAFRREWLMRGVYAWRFMHPLAFLALILISAGIVLVFGGLVVAVLEPEGSPRNAAASGSGGKPQEL